MRRGAFLAAAALLLYTLVGYPVLAWGRARYRPRPVAAGPFEPAVTVIIAAHNEQADIGAKLDNLATLDYPADQMEILVASDGSTDETDSIVHRHPDRRIKLLELPRRGKAAALNAAREVASGEILVFTDANSMLDSGALKELMRPLADPRVGGVAGDQQYLPSAPVGVEQGERSYWSLERQLKRWESIAGNAISGTGALYAIRASLYRSVPDGLTDDFYVSTGVIAAGFRLVFAPTAVAREPIVESVAGEFRRKRRVAVRILRTQIVVRELFDPARTGFYAFQLLSHKTMRHLLPLPMLTASVALAALWGAGWTYRVANLAQFGAAALGVVGVLFHGRALARHPLVSIPAYVTMALGAQLTAILDVARGSRIEHWTPGRGARSL